MSNVSNEISLNITENNNTSVNSITKPKPNRNTLVLISGILGTLYSFYLCSYFFGAASSSLSGGLATVLIMPHMICVVLATIFTWITFGTKAKWGVLTAGILYSVSILLMFIYAPFVIIQLVLSFVAFAKMKQPKQG